MKFERGEKERRRRKEKKKREKKGEGKKWSTLKKRKTKNRFSATQIKPYRCPFHRRNLVRMVFLSMKHVAKLKATKPEEGGRIENGESRDLISLNRFEPNLSLSLFFADFYQSSKRRNLHQHPLPPREMVQSTVASSTNLVDPSIPKRSSSVFVVFDGTRAQHERRPPICFHSTPLHVLVSLMYIYIYIHLSIYVRWHGSA